MINFLIGECIVTLLLLDFVLGFYIVEKLSNKH